MKKNKRSRNLIINITVLTVTCLLAFSAIEGYFRIRAFHYDKAVFERWENEDIKPKGSAVTLGHLVSVVDNNRMIYENKKNIYYYYIGAQVTTNSEGFRDKNYSIKKTADTIRILGIGDSVMFGQAVGDGKEYMTLLENKLNKKYPDKNWEVINTAVVGYNMVMELETLKLKGLKYKPDIVIVGFVSNDLVLPSLISSKENYLDLGRSFALDFIKERMGRLDRQTIALRYPPQNPEMVLPEYRVHLGWDAFYSSMDELKALSMEHGFKVFGMFFTHEHGIVSQKAMEEFIKYGFGVVNMAPSLQAYLQKNNFESFEKSPLIATPTDFHPSFFSHNLGAETILKKLEDNGLIQKLSHN
ncbi:SGNH/GDSL hydrolase family protein [Nitrospirota bacterium]